MFDKKLYWKRRNNVDKETKEPKPLRGQGDTLRPTVIPKGEKVYRENSKGEKVEVLNAQGERRVFSPTGKLIVMNRTESRRKVKSRLYTKKGYRNGVKIT